MALFCVVMVAFVATISVLLFSVIVPASDPRPRTWSWLLSLPTIAMPVPPSDVPFKVMLPMPVV